MAAKTKENNDNDSNEQGPYSDYQMQGNMNATMNQQQYHRPPTPFQQQSHGEYGSAMLFNTNQSNHQQNKKNNPNMNIQQKLQQLQISPYLHYPPSPTKDNQHNQRQQQTNINQNNEVKTKNQHRNNMNNNIKLQPQNRPNTTMHGATAIVNQSKRKRKNDMNNIKKQQQQSPVWSYPQYPPPPTNDNRNNVNNYTQEEKKNDMQQPQNLAMPHVPTANINENNQQQHQMSINPNDKGQNMKKYKTMYQAPFATNVGQYKREHTCCGTLIPEIGTIQNRKLQAINQHIKPSTGKRDPFKCIEHGASTKSGMNIKSCLKHLLDNNQLIDWKIVERLEEEYSYSCIVWEDLKIKSRQMDVGGIEGAISTWLITDKSGAKIIARYEILIVYGQKEKMKAGGSSTNNLALCIKYLLTHNRSEFNATKVAMRLETEFNYSSFVYEDLTLESFEIYVGGIETEGISKFTITGKYGMGISRYNIMIIDRQKPNMKKKEDI